MPTIKTGDWLKRWRDAGGLTVTEFANGSGVSEPDLEAIEEGRKLGSPQQWMSIYQEVAKLKIPDELANIHGAGVVTRDEEELNDLEMDIEAYGRNAPCELYYYVTDNG